MKKDRLIQGLIPAGILVFSYVLVKYMLFSMHGMKQWPFILMIITLPEVILGICLNRKVFPWFASCSYGAGFFFALLFHSRSVDPGGGTTDNLWIIWTIAVLAIMVAGLAAEAFFMRSQCCDNETGDDDDDRE